MDIDEALLTSLADPSTDKQRISIEGNQEPECPEVLFGDTLDSGHPAIGEGSAYLVPQRDVEFESENHAYKCYNRYAAIKGFSVRKDYINRSKLDGSVVSRRHICHKEGYGPSKPNAYAKKPRMETRTGCLAHMTIQLQPNGKLRVIDFEEKHNHEFATPVRAHLLPSQRRVSFSEAVEAELANNRSALDGVPKLGMGFDSDEHAYDFYNAYAGRTGFSVRKGYSNKSKVDGGGNSRNFTCFREGYRVVDKRRSSTNRPRKETRIG